MGLLMGGGSVLLYIEYLQRICRRAPGASSAGPSSAGGATVLFGRKEDVRRRPGSKGRYWSADRAVSVEVEAPGAVAGCERRRET
eukprot:gene14171-biopygen9621